MKTLFALGLLSLTLLSHSSYALFENTVGSLHQDRMLEEQERVQARTMRIVQIRGNLICEKEALQLACQLKIRETSSGKVFALSDSDSAMNLFNSGNRNILIEGILSNSSTIQVKRIQTL